MLWSFILCNNNMILESGRYLTFFPLDCYQKLNQQYQQSRTNSALTYLWALPKDTVSWQVAAPALPMLTLASPDSRQSDWWYFSKLSACSISTAAILSSPEFPLPHLIAASPPCHVAWQQSSAEMSSCCWVQALAFDSQHVGEGVRCKGTGQHRSWDLTAAVCDSTHCLL